MTTIALLGLGAMGSAVGARLKQRGARVISLLEGRSEASRQRAAASGIEGVAFEAIVAADAILSVVPPNEAVPLAGRLGPSIGGRTLFVDCNAINPATAGAVGAALSAGSARYVDGSIVGGPPKSDEAGPVFYLAGDDAGEAAELLGAHGIATKVLPGGIGAASALKMSYAGITKGLIALAAAMMLAAERGGVAEALAAELAASQPALLERFRRAVPDMLPKAYRWVPEMREIAGFIGDGPGGEIYSGAAELYDVVARDPAVGEALLGFFEGRR